MPRNHPSDTPRPIEIIPSFIPRHPANVLYVSGATRVLCAATLTKGVPPFLEGTGRGWATAEYSLLPVSTLPRADRDRGGKISGRTQEIQRLIGRSLRGILDLEALDGATLQVDCDVLQADGGTRTASINGAYVAMAMAVHSALAEGIIGRSPLRQSVGAMSAGMIAGRAVLDLDYEDDSSADVDLNLVLAGDGSIIEIQATAEREPLARADLDRLVDLAAKGIDEVFRRQAAAIEAATGGGGG
jgi:ribonuclease PH